MTNHVKIFKHFMFNDYAWAFEYKSYNTEVKLRYIYNRYFLLIWCKSRFKKKKETCQHPCKSK